MSGPADALHDLLALQDLDLALDQLRHRRAALPERAELSRLTAEGEDLARQLSSLESTRRELSERQSHAEAELSATEERAAAVDKRLYQGGVASRDLQAMSAELDQLRTRSSGLEDAVLQLLEEAEPLDLQIGELRAAIERVAGERTGAAGRLAEAEAALDTELAAAEARRREAASVVQEGLLSTYDRLRSRLGGVGVARLVGNHCDGCHLTLAAVELDRVRHLPDGEVYTCEPCGRIRVP